MTSGLSPPTASKSSAVTGAANGASASTTNGASASNKPPVPPSPRTSRLRTTTEVPCPRPHPGEILAEQLAILGITPTELARQLAVPPNRITQIISARRAITGDTALRLGHWFGTSPLFWLTLQSAYDLRLARERAGPAIARLPTRTTP